MNTSNRPVPWPEPLGVIGAGAVGLALAQALHGAGVPLVGVGSRQPAAHPAYPFPILPPDAIAARARLVFLAVPDGAVVAVAGQFPWRADQWVAHCAGSQPADILTAAVAPAHAGAFHPLAAFPRSAAAAQTTANRFAGRVVAVDGSPAVIAGLRDLAERIGARPLVVPPAARPAYHLAASLASNALVALVATATDIWRAAGLEADLALPALLPLIGSTVANLEAVGMPDALTGPIARGDVGTVARHLAALAGDPALAPVAAIYRRLGARAVELARAQGHADPAALDAILRLLSEA